MPMMFLHMTGWKRSFISSKTKAFLTWEVKLVYTGYRLPATETRKMGILIFVIFTRRDRTGNHHQDGS